MLSIIFSSTEIKINLLFFVSNEHDPNFLKSNSKRIRSRIGLTIVVNTETISISISSLFSPAIINPSSSDTIMASVSLLTSKKLLNNSLKSIFLLNINFG